MDSGASIWAPWVEKQNKLAQLLVTVFAARGNFGAQLVAANDSIWRVGEADGHGVLHMSLLHCHPGIALLQLRCLEHSFGAEGLRSLGSWQRGEGIRRPSHPQEAHLWRKGKATDLEDQHSGPELLGHCCGEGPDQDARGPAVERGPL